MHGIAGQIAIAGPFAITVDRALHLQRAGLDAAPGRWRRRGRSRRACGCRLGLHLAEQISVISAISAAASRRSCRKGRPSPRPLHPLPGSRRWCNRDLPCSRRSVCSPSKMTSRPWSFEIADGVADHGQVFLRRGAQDFVDVEHRCLADERHDGRAGFESSATCRPVSTGTFARRVLPKAASFAFLNLSFLASREELDVLSFEPGQPPSM